MKVAWTFKIPEQGPIEASPIVWDGMIYITSNKDDVYAIDAKTGELKWQYNPKPMQLTGFPRNRGVAVYEGMVFVGMLNGHLAALDAKSGKEIWNKQTVEDPKTSFYAMQPVPYKGKILMGVSEATGAASATSAPSIPRLVIASGNGCGAQAGRAWSRHLERRFLETGRGCDLERRGNRHCDRYDVREHW